MANRPFSGVEELEKALEELDQELDTYYGAITQKEQFGLNVAIPPMPDALILYNQCKAFGIPLVDGGVLDQPYIWMQEYRIVETRMSIFEAIRKYNKDAKGTPQ